MTNISTNLMSALLNNESIDEVFRSELENAINSLLATELTAFLNYENMIIPAEIPETPVMDFMTGPISPVLGLLTLKSQGTVKDCLSSRPSLLTREDLMNWKPQ